MGRWTLLWAITNNQNEPRLSPWASYLLHGNGQPVKPLLWQLWTSIIQLPSLGVVKNPPEGRSYSFVFAYLHAHAISQVCCILLGLTGRRGSAPLSIMLISLSEYFLQLRKHSLLVSDTHYVAFGVNTCSCLFFFLPPLLFLVTLCSPREKKH